VALPFSLTRFGVCDTCFPDAELEARFTASYLAPLSAGALVVRLVPPLFGGPPERQPCFLAFSAAKRALLWRSLELVRQEPKECGEVPLSALARVERGGALGAGSAGDEVALRLLGGAEKGARVLLSFSVRGERAAAMWEGGCAALPQLARARHGGVLPPLEAAAAAAAGGAGAAAAGPAAGAAEPASTSPGAAPAAPPGGVREANKAARDAFREKLRAGGPVTMEHSAQILASRGPGEERRKKSSAGGAGGGLGASLGAQLASAAALARGAGGGAGGGGAPAPSLRGTVADAGEALKRGLSTGLSRLQGGLGSLLARPST
jgi:hypothetical protein